MNTLFLAAQGGAAGGNMMMIVMLIILGAFMYFGMIRPQKKQQQKRMKMIDQLKKGDQVVLVDGLHAKIDSVNDKDKTVVVDADGVYLTFSRMAVRQITSAPVTNTSDKSAAAAEEKAAPAKADQPDQTSAAKVTESTKAAKKPVKDAEKVSKPEAEAGKKQAASKKDDSAQK